MKDQEILRYEDGAKFVTNISGFICAKCRRYWGDDEHMARYCCHTDRKCERCDARIPSYSWTACDACRRKQSDEQWDKLEKVQWDGITPVCVWDSDQYFFDDGTLASYIEDQVAEGIPLDQIRLVLCEESDRPAFDMASHLEDYLPRNMDLPHGLAKIEKLVDDWVIENVPVAWEPSNKAIAINSLSMPEPEEPAAPPA